MYFENLARLLEIELQEDLRQYQQKVLDTPLHQRKKQGFAWYPIQINGTEIGTGEQLYISLERTSQTDEPHRFQVGDSISLFQNVQQGKNPVLNGIIVGLWRNNMRVAFPTRELPDWIDDGALGIDWLFDTASYKEMKDTMEYVKKADKLPLSRLRAVLLGEKEAEFGSHIDYYQNPRLNKSQNEAVCHILAAKDVAIIHGPPGTGKTTTLVEAIRVTLQTERQVLVTAPSNTAVDLLTQKLADAGVRVLRIGNPARMDEAIQGYSLDGQISNHVDFKNIRKLRRSADEFRKMAHKYKRSFGKDEREQRRLLFAESHKMLDEASDIEKYIVENLLQNAQVITATLVGAVNKYIKKRQFSTVFIDEAAQALEPATWIPISKAHRVVLAGDHFQLPPTVKSQQAVKEGLDKTLLEKVIEKQPQTATMLNVQYRMHEAIMAFSNQQFYHGELTAHESVANGTLLSAEGEAMQDVVAFIDTAGCSYEEKSNSESQSRYNPDEAVLLIKHLTALLQSITFTSDFVVGIISPYNAQVRYLEELLTENAELKPFLPYIRVHSIDGFQGQECNIVYISLVRSNEKGEVGFLSDTRRMNVALTRAKQKLVVIGDSATLGQHKFYKEFLTYIDSIDAYKSAWEFV